MSTAAIYFHTNTNQIPHC